MDAISAMSATDVLSAVLLLLLLRLVIGMAARKLMDLIF
jgi:hypothetical protein